MMHVIGFDVMIDEHLKPWLLELNASPSMSLFFNHPEKGNIISELDLYVKSRVV